VRVDVDEHRRDDLAGKRYEASAATRDFMFLMYQDATIVAYRLASR
jgi:hypothetical protein